MLRLFIILSFFSVFAKAQIVSIVDEWKKDKDMAGASIGFCVLETKTGSLVSEYNAHTALVPASTLKIMTTYAALSTLGLHFRYETKLYYSGSFDATTGIIDGDLIILGCGDPTLQSEHFSKDNMSVTDKWAKQLKEKGVKEIKGKIIGDASYQEKSIPDTWIWADISNYYGAVPNGLAFADNKFTMTFSTKEPNTEATLLGYSPVYLTRSLSIKTDVIAKGTEDKAIVYGDPFSFDKEVKGTLPTNKKTYTIEAALPDPALLCAETFYKSLNSFGIKCDSKNITSNYAYRETGDTRTFLFSHFSPHLENIVAQTNLKSNNLFCESLLRTLGKGDSNKGLELVKKYWETRGMAVDELYMVDGSGLSRSNTITAALLAASLCKIYGDGEIYKAFNASLPIAGKSGSMSNIGKGRYIENNLRAKTGYMERVRAYSGYVKTKSGKELAFAILVNNYNCSAKEVKLKIEKYLIALESL